MTDHAEMRVVLVKPGDVLIFGNVGKVGTIAASQLQDALAGVKEALNLAQILVFEADIDLASVPAELAAP